jgi:hypothetical protein
MWIVKDGIVLITVRVDPWDCEMLRIPHFLDDQLTDGGEVLSLTPRPAARPLSQEDLEVLISVRGRVNPRVVVWLEIDQLRNAVTSSGIKPDTFRFVA